MRKPPSGNGLMCQSHSPHGACVHQSSPLGAASHLLLLSLLALPVALLTHRRAFIFDRRADRLTHGRNRLCALSEIRHVRVDGKGLEATDIPLALVLADGRLLTALGCALELRPASAEQLAAEIASFLAIAVVLGK